MSGPSQFFSSAIVHTPVADRIRATGRTGTLIRPYGEQTCERMFTGWAAEPNPALPVGGCMGNTSRSWPYQPMRKEGAAPGPSSSQDPIP